MHSRLFVPFFLAALMSGCTVLALRPNSGIENRTFAVQETPRLRIDAPKARIQNPMPSDHFIGIALSGGGSRAANFSAASLEQLEEFGLVSGASAISGVSGGAIAGGYYALHGKRTDWPLLRSKLKTDFFGQTILKPANLTTMLLTNKTRTSFLSDVLDDVLYDKKTYQDLPHDGPIFLANATDATDGGKRVVFSYEYFYGTLHSPIQDIRLATAVATSAAFPGVFDSVTFERFRPKNSFVPELGSESRESPSYVHLFDGGAADNLGVETLWDVALTQLYGNDMAIVPPRLNSKPFILIAIDANAPNSSAVFEKMSDERQPLDRIFNKNIYDAVDALFSRQRKENLVKMGFGQARFDTITHENFGDLSQKFVKGKRTSAFAIPVLCRPHLGHYRCEVDAADPLPGQIRTRLEGFAWHISIDQIASLALRLSSGDAQVDGARKEERAALVKLQRLATQTKTHLKLTGPENCSPDVLQAALYSAARVLILDDEESRFALCDYMLAGQLINDDTVCKQRYVHAVPRFAIESEDLQYRNLSSDGNSVNVPIRCKK